MTPISTVPIVIKRTGIARSDEIVIPIDIYRFYHILTSIFILVTILITRYPKNHIPLLNPGREILMPENVAYHPMDTRLIGTYAPFVIDTVKDQNIPHLIIPVCLTDLKSLKPI